jgi:uncharacterized SAM-binding protein YcdF (DUF218 family)
MGIPGVKKRRWLRVPGWTVLVLLLWSGGFIWYLVDFGAQDRAAKCDAIIVLGAAVRNGEPSPAFAARIRHGIELWQRGLAPKLIFTGGLGHDGIICESEIGKREALRAGVPEDVILIEKASHVTWENLIEAQRLMKAHELRTAVIVSDPEHLLRASMMADDLAIAHTTSPTPYSVFRTWQTQVPFILDEFWHCHTHRVKWWLGWQKAPAE